MNSISEKDIEKVIVIKGLPKVLLISGCILFLVQNILYYLFIYYFPLDILGAFLLTTSLLLLSKLEKSGLFFATGFSFSGWIVATLVWRFLIYQNPIILESNIYGHLNVIIIFSISVIFFFVGLMLFLRIILLSEQFKELISKHKRLSEL
ncbi:MAG: hypothetical protein ACTSR2_15405, partial [Candidatus Hodarchaeales archaeon]